MTHQPDCPLCQAANPAEVIWHNEKLRVIRVGDADFPGFTRVIWQDHVSEMTDLPDADRQLLMDVVWQVEAVMRAELQPHKVNVAQLGNMVPHVHWHVIPRWPLDSRFPDAIWAPPREGSAEQSKAWHAFSAGLSQRLPGYHAALCQALSSRWGGKRG